VLCQFLSHTTHFTHSSVCPSACVSRLSCDSRWKVVESSHCPSLLAVPFEVKRSRSLSPDITHHNVTDKQLAIQTDGSTDVKLQVSVGNTVKLHSERVKGQSHKEMKCFITKKWFPSHCSYMLLRAGTCTLWRSKIKVRVTVLFSRLTQYSTCQAYSLHVRGSGEVLMA